jgi:hypothetical protein
MHRDLGPSKIVFQPFDVILSKVVTCLNLYKGHSLWAGIPDAMDRTSGDVNGFTSVKAQLFVVSCHNRPATEDVPVLCPALVSLQTQPLARIDNDPLHLVVRLVSVDLVVTPRPMIFF